MIADTTSFDLGPFKIHQRPRFDNPAFAVYLVFRGERLIGKSFSRPDQSCCEWLERTNGVYAEPSEHSKTEYGYTAFEKRRKAALA